MRSLWLLKSLWPEVTTENHINAPQVASLMELMEIISIVSAPISLDNYIKLTME